ncbi:type II toxin-antitoxin system RelE/ParE family toxin [Thermosulfurimonas sp. F29]|uniref:type II toxin-antitoxin system RelE/ParE family toxin n=1 Tax=Thermosulfurimonas sp. F29 TaxID=2867247 RepID=UPI001C8309E8|nr:type II toxin-antitoxin system RelE/ParE family toxin [Thermosulfurimonas sp. F29]MBX6422792.1 type II toxin-antitoxin system RelE/ParE family toxin [Thermosulfurimonas sp. F29]
MKIEFLEAAKEEFEEAIEYYEIQQKGLGLRFNTEVKRALQRIFLNPYMYPIVSESIRRCILHTFPYSIFYTVLEDEKVILILAIAHHHRRPFYWEDRFS